MVALTFWIKLIMSSGSLPRSLLWSSLCGSYTYVHMQCLQCASLPCRSLCYHGAICFSHHCFCSTWLSLAFSTAEHMVEPVADWIKWLWVWLSLLEFVHRFIHSDIRAYIQQASLSTLGQSIAGNPSVLWQIAEKFLRIYCLHSKTKTTTLFGHPYCTCN